MYETEFIWHFMLPTSLNANENCARVNKASEISENARFNDTFIATCCFKWNAHSWLKVYSGSKGHSKNNMVFIQKSDVIVLTIFFISLTSFSLVYIFL